MSDVASELLDEWNEWIKPTYVNRQGQTKKTTAELWRDANPGENQQLLAYRNGAISKPSLASNLGRQMVEHVEAWLLAKSVDPPPPPPPPPPPDTKFGELLPARLVRPSGTTYEASTISQLTSLLGSVPNGSTINIVSDLNGGGNVMQFTRVASGAAPIRITSKPGIQLTNFAMIEVRGAYLLLDALDVGYGTIDGIKINVSAHDVEVSGSNVHHAKRQGINIQDSPMNVQVWNNRIYSNGSDTNQDHGIYFGHANGKCVVANNVLFDNQAYQIQLYPAASGVICVCNTVDGGATRGGIVIGSESGTTDGVIVAGLIATNAPWYGIDIYNPSGGDTGNKAFDSLGFGNKLGDWRTNSSIVYEACDHVDPLYVNRSGKDFRLSAGSPAIGKIQTARYGYVPSTDINGKARTTADAGAFAA